MNDQTWAMLVGFGVAAGFRVLDWLLPKGYMARWVSEWSVKTKGDDE